jgi:hypothetical protein
MIANITLDDALILPHRANPAGLIFRERQVNLKLTFHPDHSAGADHSMNGSWIKVMSTVFGWVAKTPEKEGIGGSESQIQG